jgi:hypothetical protein
MVPSPSSCQRFGGGDFPGGQVDDGLEVQAQLLLLYGAAQARFYVQALGHAVVHLRGEEGHGIATVFFDAVHGGIGLAYQHFCTVAIARVGADA